MEVNHYLSSMRLLTTVLTIILMASCALTKKVDSGFMAFERKQYAVAVDMLADEYENTKNKSTKGEIAYLMAQSYEFLNDTPSSQEWYSKAVSHEYGLEAVRKLAIAYKKLGNYQRSLEVYNKLAQALGNNQDVQREIYVLKEIMKWESDTDKRTDVVISGLSSGYADYAPTFLSDRYIVFTSDRGEVSANQAYKWSGNDYSDLYIAQKDGSKATPFDVAINSDDNEGTAVFTRDGMTMIFTRCTQNEAFDDFCQLYTSSYVEGHWSEPTRLDFQEKEINYGHPALIEHDSVLIFSADIESGFGGKDLYYSELTMADDSTYYWSEPGIMPQTINTKGNEAFPTAYGDSLFYSSDYLEGLGGYDIFLSVLKDGTWSPPQNLKRPVNSSEDDFSYVIDPTFNRKGIVKGYFSSSRKGMGNDDIYAFTTRDKPKDKTETEEEKNPEEEIERDIYIAVKVVQSVYNIPDDPGSGIAGYEPLKSVQLNVNNTDFYTTDGKGLHIFEGEEGESYTIKASKSGFLSDRKTLSTQKLDFKGENSITLNVQLVLHPIIANKEIVLENIYYDFDKWDIREDARPTLDSLATLLKDNPQISIELSSHTDCQGAQDYNLILSQKRAQSAVDYIASKGVPSRRMRSRGYGENEPRNTCPCDSCTEDEHQQNRRTSFKILQ